MSEFEVPEGVDPAPEPGAYSGADRPETLFGRLRRSVREAWDDAWDDPCETCGNTCGNCDACDGCDCNLLLRVSTLLFVAAALAPRAAGRRPVLALLAFYQRRLTRFTPSCPSTPSCSAFTVTAVQDFGPRRGLAAAARRVRRCGRPSR